MRQNLPIQKARDETWQPNPQIYVISLKNSQGALKIASVHQIADERVAPASVVTRSTLVTGATGKTSGYVVRFLIEPGHRVRAFVHCADARAQRLVQRGADVVVGDLLDPNAAAVRCHLRRCRLRDASNATK